MEERGIKQAQPLYELYCSFGFASTSVTSLFVLVFWCLIFSLVYQKVKRSESDTHEEKTGWLVRLCSYRFAGGGGASGSPSGPRGGSGDLEALSMLSMAAAGLGSSPDFKWSNTHIYRSISNSLWYSRSRRRPLSLVAHVSRSVSLKLAVWIIREKEFWIWFRDLIDWCLCSCASRAALLVYVAFIWCFCFMCWINAVWWSSCWHWSICHNSPHQFCLINV